MSADNKKEIKEVFSQFQGAYKSGNLSSIKHLFLKDAKASFSNHGDFEGPDSIIEGLSKSVVSADIVRHHVTNEYIATSAGMGQQSAYLTGLVADEIGDKLNPTWFGGHYANTYQLTEEGWKIAEIRFELDWKYGQHRSLSEWPEPRTTLGWHLDVKLPNIISGLDAPWHVIPNPEETGSDADQILDAFTRYTWAVDQWDISLLSDIYTDDITTNIVPFGEVKGRREFMSTLQVFRTGRVNLHHAVGDYRIEVMGDKATAQIYRLVLYNVSKETLNRNIFGATYHCSLRREEGVWKFENISYTEGELFEI
jgi:ketosteroid isomerase-like protein